MLIVTRNKFTPKKLFLSWPQYFFVQNFVLIYEKEMRKKQWLCNYISPIDAETASRAAWCWLPGLIRELWETQDDLFVSLLHNLFLCTKFCFGLWKEMRKNDYLITYPQYSIWGSLVLVALGWSGSSGRHKRGNISLRPQGNNTGICTNQLLAGLKESFVRSIGWLIFSATASALGVISV